ncbi:hypothetical protein AEM42_06960 [Betaproteobacteria bacterium UKL13-2]|jgi:hypothetical protein|nr:hypothetical protein AEM42_06960 [Betaproteobacteria bacterium UKL13-2]HCG54319.1 ornithine acetyltransferase [Betaproteobacteria bacterium]
MTPDLITPENLTNELLKSILDAAYMDTSYDSDGDVKVREDITCFLVVDAKRKNKIRLLTQFGFKPEASELSRLQAVNNINEKYAIVRATSIENDNLQFSWDIPIAGGITPKAIVLAIKRFCSIPRDAVLDYAKDITN